MLVATLAISALLLAASAQATAPCSCKMRYYNSYGHRIGENHGCRKCLSDCPQGPGWGSVSPDADADFWTDTCEPQSHGGPSWYYNSTFLRHRYPYAFRPTLYHRYNGSVDLTSYAPPLREYRLYHNGVDNYLQF